MKRPLAYITAAWCGDPDTDMEIAARYCRMAYEAGFSPICPILYLPLFINDAIPEEHKNGIDMRRDMLRRSHVLVVCGGEVDEDVKNDIAVAKRLNITATTLDGKLTVGGLTLNDLPVYVLSLPVDETGKVLDASEAQVYAARKTNTGDTNPRDIDVTLPDVSGNGYAVAVVQPSQDHGTLVIQGPETIERNKTGEHYPVTYTVTYDMSESMESMIEQSGGEAEYVLTIDRDTRLVGNPGRFIGNPGRFNGESISVTYRLPHSEFRVGDVLLASAMLRITVGEGDYIIPSNVTKTRKVETTYSLTTQVNGGNGTISASKAGLAAGSHETIVFTPDSGYQIDTVTVNGVKAEVRSNMLEVIMDADKTVIVTYKGIPHVHNHGTAWKSDADNHWHECPCGDRKDVAAHSFKWVIDKEPTAIRKGSKHEECTVCGYKKAAVAIPAKGSTVKPSDQTDKSGNTASANTGDSSDPVLWSALLFISGGAVIGTTVVSRKKKYNR